MIKFDSVSYIHPNGIKALDDINLKIKSGEIVAIVGSNGAGKTTLAKHINGLLKANSGTVKVFNRNTNDHSVAELSRNVGVIFQNADHQIFSDTVENEISFALKNFSYDPKLIKKKTKQALQLMNLYDFKDKSPLILSGGEKKRLCLAAILAWDPKILILDEPTVGQDQSQKVKLHQIISQLSKKGKTILIISHDLEFIWPLQPRIIVMSQGKILFDGSAQEAFNNTDLISDSDLVKPQLVNFSQNLSHPHSSFFVTVSEVKDWVLTKIKGN
jgi:energy-coupling factor transport system ATP-binding protein